MSNLLNKITSFSQPFGETAARKDELRQTANSYKQALDEKIIDLKDDASRIGKQALVIGGVIAAVYLLLELVLPDDEDEPNNVPKSPVMVERNNESSWLGKAVQSMAMTAILALAKQKLEEFLAIQNQTNATANTDTNPES